MVIHGGAGDVSRFIWPLTSDDDFWHEISLLQEEVGAFDRVIAGHCGIGFERRIDGVHWINTGVIGMPANNGSRETGFAVLKECCTSFRSLKYDVDGAVRAMTRAGSPQGYAEALKTGFWPSENILPKPMRRQSVASG